MIKLDEGYKQASSQNLPKVVTCLASYQQSAELRGVKTSRSTRPEYDDAAVGYVRLRREGGHCTVKARVYPEHKVRDKGYQSSVVIDEDDETIAKAECHDCPASKGGCKHAYPFVAWLHRRSEEASPTDVTCYWKKSRLSSLGTKVKCHTIEEINNTKNNLKENQRMSDKQQAKPTNTNNFLECI